MGTTICGLRFLRLAPLAAFAALLVLGEAPLTTAASASSLAASPGRLDVLPGSTPVFDATVSGTMSETVDYLEQPARASNFYNSLGPEKVQASLSWSMSYTYSPEDYVQYWTINELSGSVTDTGRWKDEGQVGYTPPVPCRGTFSSLGNQAEGAVSEEAMNGGTGQPLLVGPGVVFEPPFVSPLRTADNYLLTVSPPFENIKVTASPGFDKYSDGPTNCAGNFWSTAVAYRTPLGERPALSEYSTPRLSPADIEAPMVPVSWLANAVPPGVDPDAGSGPAWAKGVEAVEGSLEYPVIAQDAPLSGGVEEKAERSYTHYVSPKQTGGVYASTFRYRESAKVYSAWAGGLCVQLRRSGRGWAEESFTSWGGKGGRQGLEAFARSCAARGSRSGTKTFALLTANIVPFNAVGTVPKPLNGRPGASKWLGLGGVSYAEATVQTVNGKGYLTLTRMDVGGASVAFENVVRTSSGAMVHGVAIRIFPAV